MLNVQTIVKRSPLQGLGLFAAEPISAGTIIWSATRFTFIEFSAEDYLEMKRTLSAQSFSQLENYMLKLEGKYFLCADDARYLNHSVADCNTVFDPIKKTLAASRDLALDDEILENYDLFYPEEGTHDYGKRAG